MTICFLAVGFDTNSILNQIYATTINSIAVTQTSITDILRVDFQTKPQTVNVGKTFIITASITNNSPNTITFTVKCNSLSPLTLDNNSQVKQLQSEEVVNSGPIRFISLDPKENQLIIDPCSKKYEAISEGKVTGTANLKLYDDGGISPKYSFQKQVFEFRIIPKP